MPEGGNHFSFLILLTASTTPRQGDVEAQAALVPHRLPLSQWGFLQKQGQAPSEGQAEQEDAVLGFGRGVEPNETLQPYLPTPNQPRGSALPPSPACPTFFT